MVGIKSCVTLPLIIRDQVLHQHCNQLGLGMGTVPGLRDDAVELGFRNGDVLTKPHCRGEGVKW